MHQPRLEELHRRVETRGLDDASHLLLGELLRLRQRGLLLILAGRPEAISAAQDFDLQAVPLHPLSGEESETVITGLLRSADPFRQGGGRPYSKADRSRFLDVLEREVRAAK